VYKANTFVYPTSDNELTKSPTEYYNSEGRPQVGFK